jgi:endo-1,4-beta-xylanase
MFAAMKEQYIADAFKYAAAAVQASGKSIDLYYNDYNLAKADKRAKTLKMAKALRAQGVRIDGIGEQGHWSMTWPSPAEIQTMIDDFVQAGFKVKISELDISVYPKDDWDNKVWEPERPFDEALALAQATRYKEIFEVFVKNAEHITSVTFWGLTDDRTWLDFMPVQGRNNYPLLFNDLDQPKPAYFALFDVQKP